MIAREKECIMNDRWRRQEPCRILTQQQQHERRGAADRMLGPVQAINCQTHQDRKKQCRNKEGCSSIEGNRARDSTQVALLYIESPNPYIFTALFFYAFSLPPPSPFYRFPASSLESGATFHSSSNERKSRSNFL